MQCHTNGNSNTKETSMSERIRQYWSLCLGGGALLLIAIKVFAIPLSTIVTFGIFLLCPLMHIFMMGHDHDHGQKQN